MTIDRLPELEFPVAESHSTRHNKLTKSNRHNHVLIAIVLCLIDDYGRNGPYFSFSCGDVE